MSIEHFTVPTSRDALNLALWLAGRSPSMTTVAALDYQHARHTPPKFCAYTTGVVVGNDDESRYEVCDTALKPRAVIVVRHD